MQGGHRRWSSAIAAKRLVNGFGFALIFVHNVLDKQPLKCGHAVDNERFVLVLLIDKRCHLLPHIIHGGDNREGVRPDISRDSLQSIFCTDDNGFGEGGGRSEERRGGEGGGR